MTNLHLCYAGAGAGKTHTLVQTYLMKALKKPAFFGRILAITFTNKATEEMKGRIISYLDRLVKGRHRELGEALQKALACDAATLQHKANALLSMILHSYEEFSVCTIDGFFQMIIRAFAAELGLPLSYGLLLDVAPILEDTLWELLATLGRYPRLVSAFSALSIHKIQQGKSWDCTGAIRQLAKMLLLDHGNDLGSGEAVQGDGATIEDFFQSQKAAGIAFKAQLKDMAGDLLQSIKAYGLCVDDFAWGRHGVVGFLEKVYAKKEAKPSTRIYNAVAKRGHWVSAKSEHYRGMAAVVQDYWQPQLEALLDLYDKGYKQHATFRALQPLYYAMASIAPLRALLSTHALLQTNLPVAYLPALLGKVEAGVAVPFLYEKLGRQYETLLIDEFQDVSRAQWARLHPLLDHGLARGHDSFLVGDVKQAIYRWRGGDAGLFLSGVAATIGADRIKEVALAHNWRSRRHIVAFNNVFFETAAEALTTYLGGLVAEVGGATLREGADHLQIKQAYKHVAQELPKTIANSDLGYVELAFFPKKGGTKETPAEDYHWQDGAIARTIKKVEELQQAGHKLSDIGILVRDNKEASKLLDAFLGYKKSEEAIPGLSYEAHSPAGGKLGDNAYIQLLIHGLMYVADPKPGFTLTTLIHLYQTYGGDEMSGREFSHQYWTAGSQEPSAESAWLPQLLLTEATTLGRLPLYLLVDKLISLFGLRKEASWPYIAIFQGQVEAFIRDHAGHLMDFLAWWERVGHRSSCGLDAAENSLQVMTIHQAKGLAFNIVLLPFCVWPLDHPPTLPTILWSATTATPFDALKKAPLYYGTHLKDTYYKEGYHEEQIQAYLGNLNLLYVAFTRARKGLYIFMPDTEGKRLGTVADVVKKVISTNSNAFSAEKGWQSHTVVWKETKIAVSCVGNTPVAKKGYIDTPKPPPIERVLYGRNMLKKGASDTWEALMNHHDQVLDGLVPENDKEEGIWWHDLLSQVKVKEDIPKLLASYVATQELTAAEMTVICEEIAQWWEAHPLLADWFSKRWQVKKERSILLSDGTSFRPDRVMILGSKAIVLDFKTGHPKSADAQQVQKYMALLETMAYTPVAGYLFYTRLNRLVAV